MTASEYRNAGYKVSDSVSQSAIDAAEADAAAYYVEPVKGGDYDPESVTEKACVMALAFILLSRSGVAVSRSGAVTKRAEESERAELEKVLQYNAAKAHALLSELGDAGKCSDIAGIYFKSNYFYNH